MPPLKRYFAGLAANTFLLSFASLFSDVSTEMLYPVLPIFLTQTLGASASAVGIVDGVAQALQNIIQGVSGSYSDKVQRRKPIALFGYAIGAIAKPLIGFATTWPGVLGARSLDRLASGTRSAPRDALIAASVDEAHRGKAFGLEGVGDNLGAFLGPLLAILLLDVFHVGLRSIFMLAIIPGALAALMVVFVREKPAVVHAKATLDLKVRQLPPGYWKYLGAVALFGLGNSSNSFLILRARELGASLTLTIFIYALYNLVAALASYPAGYLSDKLGRKSLLLLAVLIFAVVYAGFGLTSSVSAVAFLFPLYGIYQGIFRSVGKAFATDFVPAERRASGVGWYTAAVGSSGLVASIVGGELWTRFSPAATFMFGAGCALLGALALLLLVPAKLTEAVTR
jgi:MFS family permease